VSCIETGFFRKAPLLLLLLLTCSVYADTTGIISGYVSDTEGNQLVGATVMIEGTSLGTMMNATGEYIIAGIPPGSYSVTANMAMLEQD